MLQKLSRIQPGRSKWYTRINWTWIRWVLSQTTGYRVPNFEVTCSLLLSCGKDMYREILQTCPVAWEQWRVSNNHKSRKWQSRENKWTNPQNFIQTRVLSGLKQAKWIVLTKLTLFQSHTQRQLSNIEELMCAMRFREVSDLLYIFWLCYAWMAELGTWQWKHNYLYNNMCGMTSSKREILA